ncbi:MAG: response regulator transcription factor, partial [Eubacterium sp.]
RSDDMDQIHAISEGGDDYITKPYSFNVLIAKIQAQLRRAYGAYAAPNVSEIRFGDACFHPGRLTLQCQDTIQSLSKTEAAVVHSLFRHAPDVVTRESLLSTIWDDECFVEENTLNVTISRIRKRLDQISSVLQIVAVRGIGYRLAVPGDPKP